MSLTVNDVKALLIADLPPGSNNLYDFGTPTSKISRLFTGLAQSMKQYGYDQIDALFLETNPVTIVQNIPNWEIAAGLVNSKTVLYGTTTQRRNQIIGQLRGSGSFSLDDFRAVCEPFYLYQDPRRIRIIEPNRDNLRALHSYTGSSGLTTQYGVTSAAPATIPIDIRNKDLGVATDQGAIISFYFTGSNLEDVSLLVTNPSAPAVSFNYGFLGVGASADLSDAYIPIKVYVPQLAGVPFNNIWTLKFYSANHSYVVGNVTIFVEGILGDQTLSARLPPPKNLLEGLSSSMYYWSPLAETTLLGSSNDLPGCQSVLEQIKPAHTLVTNGFFEEKTILIDYPRPAAETSDYWGIWGVSTEEIYICTADGTILKFNGATWLTDSTLVAGNILYGISGTTTTNVWAVGATGTVVNKGLTGWKDYSVGGVDLFDVAVFDDGSAIIVGDGGTIYSVDPQKNFTTLTSPTINTLSAIYTASTADKTNIWIVGNGGVILRSVDGIHFSLVTSPTVQNLISINGDGPNNIYACGASNTLIKWNGVSWATVTTTATNLNAIAMTPNSLNDIWIASNGGVVYHKGPYASLFTAADITSTTKNLLAAWMQKDTVMWMTGKDGTIIRFAPNAIYPDNTRAIPDACFPS